MSEPIRSRKAVPWIALAGVVAVAAVALQGTVDARSGPSCAGVPATITGTDGDDELIGTRHRDVIVAREGDDTIRGGGGDDLICAGPGDDVVFAGDGDDVVLGDDGKDRIRGGPGDDEILAGAGYDRVDGQDGDDRIVGDRGNDVLAGGPGNDRLDGGLGRNRMYGGEGSDHLIGGAFGESLDGGPGDDRVFGNGGNDWIVGGEGHDLLNGGDSHPARRVCDPTDRATCRDDAVDVLVGGPGEDRILGAGGPDDIDGGDGRDTVEAGPGDDVIAGRSGRDFIDGGSGSDTASSGVGNDRCLRVEDLADDCPEPAATLPLGEWRGSAEGRQMAELLFGVVMLQDSCEGDAIGLAQLEAAAAVAPTEIRSDLRNGVAHLRRMVQACNTDPAQWAGALDAAAGALDRIAPSVAHGENSDPLLDAANHAAAAVEAFSYWTTGLTERYRPSLLWSTAQHYGRSHDMADLNSSGGFDVVAIGSSLMVNAFDAERFTSADGRSAFNAGLPTMGPEKIGLWLPTVIRLGSPETIVYGFAPRAVKAKHRVPGSCLDDASDWIDLVALEESIFAPVDGLAGTPWETLVFGDPMRAETHPAYHSEFTDRGTRLDFPQHTTAQIVAAAAKNDWDGPFPQCPEREAMLAANIAAIAAAGIDPVVVFMPMSSYRIGMFDGGRTEVDAVLSQLEATALAGGAVAVIDLSGAVPDSGFRDLSHVNAAGAAAFIDALVAGLSGLEP